MLLLLFCFYISFLLFLLIMMQVRKNLKSPMPDRLAGISFLLSLPFFNCCIIGGGDTAKIVPFRAGSEKELTKEMEDISHTITSQADDWYSSSS